MNTPLIRWWRLPALAIVLVAAGGCVSSTPRLAHHDIAGIQLGMPRADVLKELGRPVTSTRDKAGLPVEIFTFVQESNPDARKPQPIDPGEEDEQAMKILLAKTGFSASAMIEGQTLTVQVNYDENDVVKHTLLLDMTK